MQPEHADRYPLAPLQRGMLFHALATPESTMYVEQHRFGLEGEVDLAAFQAAWQMVCERHPVLRTAFDWQRAERPVQVVRSVVPTPLAVEDWRAVAPSLQQKRLRRREAAERERGFDLSCAPLFRLLLVRLGERAWQLLWTHHHLILDGWSVGIVLRDVAAAYPSAQRGEQLCLPDPPRYRDFVAFAAGQDLRCAREYWTGALAGFSEPTSLGIARAAAADRSRPERISHRLARELTIRLEQFASDQQITIETLLTGAWALVLGRYAGMADVVFGVTSAGRSGPLPGLDQMVGVLINTLPARIRLDWDRPVPEWLRAIARQQARTRELELTPLDRVQAWSEIPAGRRLFDSILVVEDFPFDSSRLGCLGQLRVRESMSVQQTNFPLTLLAFPRERLVIEALFDAGPLDPRLVRQLLGHVQAVLEGLMSASLLGQVELMRPAERAVLVRRGAARASFPPDGAGTAGAGGLAPARFAAWARRTPDRIAVSVGEERISYQELLVRVARLANRLRDLGVGSGVLVGIYLPRSVDLVVAVLAVASAGGGYVPVDRRDPAARVRTILGDASVAVLVTHHDAAGELGGGPAGVPSTVLLDDPDEQALQASLPDTCTVSGVRADDVAYVIYTSGSTGAPKGVVVEHAQLARLFDATRAWFEFSAEDVWTLFHSIAFDFSVWELWGALANGGRLVVVPDELTRDPTAFRQLLLTEGVTVLNQTPSSFRALLHVDVESTPSRSPYRLRLVIFGGEMLEVSSLRAWLDRYGDRQPSLVNMYGITETTVHVTYRPIRRTDVDSGLPSPIGEPIPDLAVRVVDPWGQLVPLGVPGEIYVGGAGVARGYLRRPELTVERFVADTPETAEWWGDADPHRRRWYRTGDRARWLPEGGLEFLGRVDDQVKIRGHRIELGEVESVLNGHPRVRESVVVAARAAAGDHDQLVAYVVTTPPHGEHDAGGTGVSWSQLRGWLAQRLPDYLVPAGVVALPQLPLTPNGKVDRAALPAFRPVRPDDADVAAPRTEIERILTEIWADVLGVEQVGVTDNFFALGGDSILTIQVVSRAARRGVAITPPQLFKNQTIAGLAQAATILADAATEAEQGEVTGEVPATPMSTWFHQLSLPHAGHWNLPVLLIARQRVRPEWLAEALAALMSHHDLLRLRVTVDDRGTHHQRIVPVSEHGPIPVQEFEITNSRPGTDPPRRCLSPVDRQCFAARVDELARQVQDGLDLARGPLLRAAVFRAPPGEHDRVLLVAHHLVVDAVSWQILLEDLDTGYRQVASGSPVRLPAKTTDFPRWARTLSEHAQSEQVADEARWWLSRLAQPVPALPVEGDPSAPNREGDSDVVVVTLGEPATGQLLASAHRAYRTRPEELLLAALAQAIVHWSRVSRILVDVEGHGRDIAVDGVDVSRTVGWFTTLTPTRLDLAGVDPASPGALIKTVKEQLRAAPGRGHAYGLARCLRGDDLAQRLSRLPPAQISFNYLSRLDPGAATDAAFALAPEPVNGARHPDNRRPYLIDIVVGVQQGRLHLYLTYSTKHYSRATMDRLATSYLDVLRAVIDHCMSPGAGGATPSDFPLAEIDQDQLDRLVGEHGPIEDLYPLAPLQRGLLFHTLANPNSGVYFEQFSIRLDGDLDIDAFERAWNALLERHAVLRAAIAWQGLSVPHLVVRERVELPLRRHDWCHLPEAGQADQLRELLSHDRIQGFDLAQAPLTRLYLIRLSAQSWRLVWSHHHILLDGWSVALLIQEIFDNYEAIRAGTYVPAPPPPPYRDYIAYLAKLNLAGAWSYWRRVLSGVTEPTPLGADRPAIPTGRRDADYARVYRRLASDRSDAVREFARAHRLTLDTVLHGAWALLLAERSGCDDVVFGVTSSGRPPALSGVEQMVGLFINTLPARVRVSRDQPVISWLAGLLREQVATREFEHTPLDQIRSWTSIPPGRPLFDSGRGLENYPMDGSRFRTGSVSITEIQTFEQSNYALSFVVVPDEALFLQLWYDALRFTAGTADHMLLTVEALVLALVAEPDRTVGEVLQRVPALAGRHGRLEVQAPLPALVQGWAARQPEQIAVRGDGERLSYHQLDQRANQVAGWLHEAGARPGTRVGVALLDALDGVVAMIGILKLGAVFIALPAGAAGHELARHLQLSICLVPAGPARRDGGVLLLPFADRDRGRSTGPPELSVAPADTATVVWWYRADGAICATELSHGELTRRAYHRRDDITLDDVVAQFDDPGSEPAAWATWVALANGACLAVRSRADSAGATPPAHAGASGREQAITVLALAARDLAELLDRDPTALDGVRLLLLSGDLATPYARRLRAAQPSLLIKPAAEIAAGRVIHVLRALPLVSDAVVTPTRDGRRLTAFLVADVACLDRDDRVAARLAQRHVEQWRALYDQTYANVGPADPTFNIVGWNSSYTGAPITAEAMAEWRAHTLDRIRALNPASLLEIGCGTGLVLFGLLDECERYVGTDFSPVCLAQVRDYLTTRDSATRAKVTLLERPADDVTGLEPGSFDVIILNSVVQYFPGSEYLARVLEAALTLLTPSGCVFLGDLRQHGLREAFHVSVELHRAVDLLPIDELSARVARSLEHERELLVDPRYITRFAAAHPEVGVVELMPKRGRVDTELTRYRYDAVLRLGAPPLGRTEVRSYDWSRDVLTRNEVGWVLDHADADTVEITGVPNARVAADVQAARLLNYLNGPNTGALSTAGELRIAAGKAPPGLDPEELYQIGERKGWSVAVSWATNYADGALNALYWRGPDRPATIGSLHAAGPVGEQPAEADGALTNAPLRSGIASELEQLAWQALRESLPDDANVSRVLVVDELARMSDGRVDEAALPIGPDTPEAAGPAGDGRVPPRTADELRLARIWEQALRVRSIDVRTSFFDLGGDSLLAIRVIDEAARVLDRDVPLAVLLREPTIEGMAAALRADRGPWTPLVEIAAGTGTPFFCVHPAGGGVLCYAELSRLIGSQPFYALAARGIEGDEPPYDDLPTMAARYLQDVRARQPAGPYLLGGWSMGGLVAYEMAQQLVSTGSEVGLLVLIETPTPDLVENLPDEAVALARLLEGILTLDLDQLRQMPAAQRLRHVLAEAERTQVIPPGMDADRTQQLFQVYSTHLDAVRRYQPRPYGGRTCLILAEQSEITADENGWGALLAGQWELIEVPGSHETIVWPPNVARLADVLRAQLAAAMTTGV